MWLWLWLKSKELLHNGLQPYSAATLYVSIVSNETNITGVMAVLALR